MLGNGCKLYDAVLISRSIARVGNCICLICGILFINWGDEREERGRGGGERGEGVGEMRERRGGGERGEGGERERRGGREREEREGR